MVWNALFSELFSWYGIFCFWNCSHGIVLFLELFSWYGMFCFLNCSNGMVCFVFGAVLMVCYVLFFGTVLMVW